MKTEKESRNEGKLMFGKLFHRSPVPAFSAVYQRKCKQQEKRYVTATEMCTRQTEVATQDVDLFQTKFTQYTDRPKQITSLDVRQEYNTTQINFGFDKYCFLEG